MSEEAVSCIQTAWGPLVPLRVAARDGGVLLPIHKKVQMVSARAGDKAPDSEATAYCDGGFRNGKQSDYPIR